MKFFGTLSVALIVGVVLSAAICNSAQPAEELKARLDEAGVKYKTFQMLSNGTAVIDFEGSGISDLTVLKDAPVKMLCLASTAITNIAPLKGMQLEVLDLRNTGVEDISPLKKMPLEVLLLANSKVTDLRPLKNIPLIKLTFTPALIKRGLDLVREMKSLKTIGVDDREPWQANEFWKRFDAGEFKNK